MSVVSLFVMCLSGRIVCVVLSVVVVFGILYIVLVVLFCVIVW